MAYHFRHCASNTTIGHRAAHAAHQQAQFWGMHDWIYENYNLQWEPDFQDLVRAQAEAMGLDMATYDVDYASDDTTEFLTNELADVIYVYQVSSIPSVWVNGVRLPNRGLTEQIVHCLLYN